MHLMWWTAGTVLLLGFVIAVIGLLTAKDGYEDGTGFHPCKSSDPRLTPGPACALPGDAPHATSSLPFTARNC